MGFRAGFTLVELLVVIAIIGVLVGLTVPAVFAVRGTFIRGSIKFEINALADAVEKYRSKYGDYPPDGSSWPVMEKHLRKAFPNILISELNLLNPANSATYGYIHSDYAGVGRVMDPAEAMVFFLGGFSSDGQRPFTGPGGPFSLVGTTYQYNGSRQNPFYEFPSNRLTLTAAMASSDETAYGGTADILPVFLSYNNALDNGSPYVYFDSRTYQFGTFFNFHMTRTADGAARPFLSEQLNTSTGKLIYENKQTFQILSPGSDGMYGGMNPPSSGTPTLFTSKGDPCDFVATPTPPGFVKSGSSLGPFLLAGQLPKRPAADNAGNFVETNTLGENK